MTPDTEFERLLSEGLGIDVTRHWGAGFLEGRYVADRPSWSWRGIASTAVRGARRLLDMGTGDGSALASLAPLPEQTVAYEEWRPTLRTARQTLRPHGVELVMCLGADDNPTPTHRVRPTLPFADGAFDVVLNRHESFDAGDVARIATRDAVFVTQQVGSRESAGIRELLGMAASGPRWDLARATAELHAAGWQLTASGEEAPAAHFCDIAALIAYVRSTPWAFDDVDVEDPDWWRSAPMPDRLRDLHALCGRDGEVTVASHRFWVSAVRTGG